MLNKHSPNSWLSDEWEGPPVLGASEVELVVKEPTCQCRRIRDLGSIPGLGRCPGGGNGSPLQYSFLENPMDRRAWRVTVHRATKNRTWLKWLSTHAPVLICHTPSQGCFRVPSLYVQVGLKAISSPFFPSSLPPLLPSSLSLSYIHTKKLFIVYLKLKFNWVLSFPLFYLATLNMPHLLRGLVKSLLCVNLARFYPQLFNQMLI